MDLTNLKNKHTILTLHMEEDGYSQRYIEYIAYEIEHLLKNGLDYESYFDYHQNFIKPTIKKNERNRRLGILTLIMNFDLYAEFPNKTRVKHKIVDDSNYSKLNDEFKNIIDVYIKTSNNANKKSSTIHNEALNGASFLMYLQTTGLTRINEVTENDVLSFFLNDKNELIYSCSYKKNIRAVLKAGIPHINGCERLMSYLPVLRENRKNIQFLKYDEVEAIKEVLDNDNLNINLRNKAIVSILLYTGLRGCDVVTIKLNDIDWNNEIIYITQSKTEVPLELPLVLSVGNALYEYIMYERPETELPNVFIRQDANLPITTSSIECAVRKVMDQANIRMNKGDRRGTHIFRHHLATTLLEKNIPQPVITQVLGHTSPNSLEAYLRADFIHLKKCALSVEAFPFLMEVND